MLEVWYKDSSIYRFYIAFITVLSQSVFARFVEAVGRTMVQSKTAAVLRAFASRPFYAEGSLFYRGFQGLNQKTYAFRDKVYGILKESWFYRKSTQSFAIPFIGAILIPCVAFYAFIDEIGRDLFGSSALFGYWDEAFLFVAAVFVVSQWFFKKRHQPLVSTPVSNPMILLIGASIFLLVMNTTYMQVGIEGFRVVCEYLLWFFILNSFIDNDKKAYLLVRFLVYAGGAMGLHGILQYIMKVPTPKGWIDAAEGSSGTRVFSIVGSPNILGSIFVLILPLCLALVLQRKRGFKDRLVFLVLLGAMGLSLIFTLSRGAWMGAALALFIFCLAINPRWLILLGVGGCGALFIPAVSSRITYMLSPKYAISSMTGGRLARYKIGMEMFQSHEWFGVGLGHFGGATAMNHKELFPTTFYMDNYWLKTMVEMGLVGIIAFGILMLTLVIWSVRSVKQSSDYDTRLITAAGLAGLCGVLLHNLLENVFEVPYMVVYFWLVAAVVLYFGLRRNKLSSF
ncbi:MAG: O-antigen ligase family protein [Clostridia bacterium]|nr:O-antigen ligase family protein [Clostridia bacterium]